MRARPGRLLTVLAALSTATAACGGDDSAGGSSAGGAGATTMGPSGPTTTTGPGAGGSSGAAALHTEGNHVVGTDGKPWHGRGANLHDTRSCNACTYEEPHADEVLRRVDALVDDWGANFIRLDLESYAALEGGQVHGLGVLEDPAYLADVVKIVDHIGTKAGVNVLVSVWVDPTQDMMGWPTDATNEVLKALAGALADRPHVLFGITNEPQANFDGALDADVHARMSSAVEAIRSAEDAAGQPHHVITAQGTGGWARRLDYYVDHPITAGGGDNIAYEIHVYNPESDFASMLDPAKSIPVIIGEHGPADGYMTEDDCTALEDYAEANEIPYLAWTFHQRCPPNLIEETAPGCGVGMDLVATSWGQILEDRLAKPW